jgi:hypothetical protein
VCARRGRITAKDVDEIKLVPAASAEQGRTAKIRLRVKLTVPNLRRPADSSQLIVPIDLAPQVYKSGIPRSFLSRWVGAP